MKRQRIAILLCAVAGLVAVGVFGFSDAPVAVPVAPVTPIARADTIPRVRLPIASALRVESPAGANAPAQEESQVRVVVLVRRDGALRPVSGAWVKIVTANNTAVATTDGEGRALVEGALLGETVTIWAAADGVGAARILDVRLEPQTPVELRGGARVRIRWRSPRGQELAAAEVLERFARSGSTPLAVVSSEDSVTAGAWNAPVAPLRASADVWQEETPIRWTEDACFLERPLPPGRWRVVVPRPSVNSAVGEPLVISSSAEAETWVELPGEEAARRVRLVDAGDGAPLVGARLTPWFELVKDYAYVRGASLVTGVDGEVSVPKAAEGDPRCEWQIASPSHVGSFDAAVLASGTQPLVLRIFAGATIEGIAYADSGVPARAAVVSRTYRGASSRAMTDEEGRFVLTGIAVRRAPTELVSLVLVVGEESRFYAVSATAGSTSRTTLGPVDAAARLGRVRGVVRAGDRPLPGLHVLLAPAREERSVVHTSTDAEGRFAFLAVPVGPARLRVTCGDPRVTESLYVADAMPVQIDAGATREVSLDLPDGTLRVHVTDAVTHAALPHALVLAKRVCGDAALLPGFKCSLGWSGFTDENGWVSLLGLDAGGTHRVEVLDSRRLPLASGDATPRRGADGAPLELSVMH